MNNDILRWFEKGESEKLIKKLKALVSKLTNFEKKAAASKKTGFTPLSQNDEDPSLTRETSAKFLPHKQNRGSKKLWGMALKYIPPEAKKFLRLGGGANMKTGFTRLEVKGNKAKGAPLSFMKGQFAQETQEETAARYLREEEISQRGLAPDATEEEREAQQALEQRQRASSAGEGFFSKPTFMKRKRPSLFRVRGVEEDTLAEDRGVSTMNKKQAQKVIRTEVKTLFEKSGDRGSGGSKAKQQFTRQINQMNLPPDARKTILGVIKGTPPGIAKDTAPALFTKRGAAAVSKPEGMVIDQPFDGLKMPKELDEYTTFKDKFEKESNTNDKPDDEVEKDISQLQEEGKKTTATLIELEKKLTELEKESPAETQGNNMTESQANRSAPESSTIDNFMNRTNKVIWSPV